MGKIKDILKEFIPPVVFSFFRSKTKQVVGREVWEGNYASWNDAKSQITGYDSDLILEKCKTALLKVKNGEATYERDSILFDEKQYSWGVLAGLERAALEANGKLCVLDFGGSLGSSYFQNKDFLSFIKDVRWCIVEQSQFVDCGKKYFQNEQLKFYHSVEECMAENKPNVLLLSSVLQYLEQPKTIIDKILDLQIPYLILDRLSVSNEARDILSVQHVSKEFYESVLGHWFFSHQRLIDAFSGKYNLLATSDSYSDKPVVLNGKTQCFFKFLLLKLK